MNIFHCFYILFYSNKYYNTVLYYDLLKYVIIELENQFSVKFSYY